MEPRQGFDGIKVRRTRIYEVLRLASTGPGTVPNICRRYRRRTTKPPTYSAVRSCITGMLRLGLVVGEPIEGKTNQRQYRITARGKLWLLKSEATLQRLLSFR